MSEINETKTEEVKQDAIKILEQAEEVKAEEVKESTKAVKEENSDLFITEKDTFDSEVEFYNSNGTIFVKGIDPEYDITKQSRKMTFTCKYPSMSDLATITNIMANKQITEFKATDFMLLEFSRLSVLIRRWSLPQDMSRMGEINPKIIKAMLAKIQEKIGLQGLL